MRRALYAAAITIAVCAPAHGQSSANAGWPPVRWYGATPRYEPQNCVALWERWQKNGHLGPLCYPMPSGPPERVIIIERTPKWYQVAPGGTSGLHRHHKRTHRAHRHHWNWDAWDASNLYRAYRRNR